MPQPSSKPFKRTATTTTTTPTTAAHPHLSPLPKTLRLYLRPLLSNHARLLDELHLLRKLWYKGRSQFRTATWWKHFDALRRCLVRLCGTDDRDGQMGRTSDAVIAALSAAFGVSPPSLNPPNTSRGVRSMPTFVIPPSSSSSSSSSHTADAAPLPAKPFELAAREVYTLSLLLHETGKRARTAYRLASLHLRTPPAPTFAPQATILLALSASVERLATDTVLGVESTSAQSVADEGEGERNKNGCVRLYRCLRGVVETVQATPFSAPPDAAAAMTTQEDVDMQSTNDVEPRPKGTQRPSKRKRQQMRKARTSSASPAPAPAPLGSKDTLSSLPPTIPDPLSTAAARRRRRHLLRQRTTQHNRPRTSSSLLPFHQAVEAYDIDKAAKNARRFFSSPVNGKGGEGEGRGEVVSRLKEDGAARVRVVVDRVTGGGGAGGGVDEGEDDLGEAIAR